MTERISWSVTVTINKSATKTYSNIDASDEDQAGQIAAGLAQGEFKTTDVQVTSVTRN